MDRPDVTGIGCSMKNYIHKFIDQASADAMIAGWLKTQSVSPPGWEFTTTAGPSGVSVFLALPEWLSPSNVTNITTSIGDFALGFQHGRESR